MSIALKRHHRQRLQKVRRFHWGRDLIDDPAMLSRAITTPCPCSCWMCGNPRRKHGELTMQERRAFQRRGQ
jgi:hypothetical protein